MGRSITVTRETSADARTVWRVLTDLDRAEERLRAVTRIERIEGPSPLAVGTRWRETRVVLGREATEELVVTDVDEGRSYTVETHGDRATYRSVLSVEPLGSGGSRLAMTFGAEPTGAVGRVLAATVGRLFEGATRSMLEGDLADVALAAEREDRTD